MPAGHGVCQRESIYVPAQADAKDYIGPREKSALLRGRRENIWTKIPISCGYFVYSCLFRCLLYFPLGFPELICGYLRDKSLKNPFFRLRAGGVIYKVEIFFPLLSGKRKGFKEDGYWCISGAKMGCLLDKKRKLWFGLDVERWM